MRVTFNQSSSWTRGRGAVLSLLLCATAAGGAEVDYRLQAVFERRLERAEQGDTRAQYQVADMLLKGRGVLVDLPAARRWFAEAARRGLVKAKFKLGYMYLKGLGGEADPGRALPFMRAAAEAGYAPARFYLGEMYALGQGVERDSARAITWIKASTEEGYSPPLEELELIQSAILGGAQAPADGAPPQD